MRSTEILLSLCLSLVLMASACKQKTPVEPEPLQPDVPQWAMFGKNLRNTSNAADPVEYYSGPEQGQIVWTVDFGFSEQCWTSPSIGPDGTIFMTTTPLSARGDTIGYLYAIHPGGTIKWRFKTLAGNVADGAVGVDGTYYIGSKDKHFYAINQDGHLKWKRMFSVFASQHPAITKEGRIIVPVRTGVVALDKDSGETIWFYETTAFSGDGVSIDANGNIYTATSNGLLSLSSEGNYRWKFPTSHRSSEVMIANDGTIIFTVISDTLLYALNPDGSIKWSFDLMGWGRDDVHPAISSDGTIVALNTTRIPQKIYTLSSTGQLILEIGIAQLFGTENVSLVNTTPIIDQLGTIYLAIGRTGGDNFFALTKDGKLKWSLTIENTIVSIFPKPAIAPDGTMYVVGDHSINAMR